MNSARVTVLGSLLLVIGLILLLAWNANVRRASTEGEHLLLNLVISESSMDSGEPPRWSAAEVQRLVRPAGGVVLLGTTDNELPAARMAVWSHWLAGGELPAGMRNTADGWWQRYERGHLAGARDWSHQYGSADNTSTSLDERVRGELEVAWWGDPGPRPMPDRGPRNPAPLSANGRLYIQGDRILFGLDAYNGSVLWSVIAPEVRRANLPRDCSNTAADDTTLYVAHHEYCLEFDGQTGERRPLLPSLFSRHVGSGIERAHTI